MKKHDLWEEIRNNEKLQVLEKQGFKRGKRKGKTMDVPLGAIYGGLEKQWRDLMNAYLCCDNVGKVMRCIADLRNVAGCLFLKLDPSTKEAKPNEQGKQP